MKPVTIKKIPIEEFREQLKKDGIEINAEQAVQLLDLIYYFSALLVKEFLENDIVIR